MSATFVSIFEWVLSAFTIILMVYAAKLLWDESIWGRKR